jgi:hypothetical protein
LANWTGLDPSAPKALVTKAQFRATSALVATATKAEIYRKSSLTVKFARTDDLINFEYAVWLHLVNTGMDYIACPVEDMLMVPCVTSHGRFTVDSTKKLVAKQVLLNDCYDMSNDCEANEFLLNLIEIRKERGG